MGADLYLPATPALRRIARAFLGFDPWDRLILTSATSPWLVWSEGRAARVLPLLTGAGLAIAYIRLDEVAGPRWDTDHPPEEMARVLREMDPELQEDRRG